MFNINDFSGCIKYVDGREEYYVAGQCFGNVITEDYIDLCLKKQSKENDSETENAEERKMVTTGLNNNMVVVNNVVSGVRATVIINGRTVYAVKNERKLMEKPLKRLLGSVALADSVIRVDNIDDLVNRGLLTRIVANTELEELNRFFKITGTELALIEASNVEPAVYKLVSTEDIHILLGYKFIYARGNFRVSSCIDKEYTCLRGKTLEQVIVALHQGVGALDGNAVHHKWFRWCAMPEALEVYGRDMHCSLHGLLGRYSHRQVLLIADEQDLQQFIGVVQSIIPTLAGHVWSIIS